MATESLTLSYRLKLFPTRVKADTLAALVGLFQRLHSVATQQIAAADRPRQPSTTGQGQFAERAARRAIIDFLRARKAARAIRREFKLPHLHAELIDAAEIHAPRKATAFDLWIMIQGARLTVPARKHKALNRALAFPGATLGKRAVVFRKNRKWYASVPVTIPCPEPYQAKGWLGCDVGVRKSVVRSDGYKGPDLRPILKHQREKNAERQRQGLNRSLGHQSPQRQRLAHEARLAVLVALKTGRGIAVESPERLIRWRQHAARFFGNRALLLAAIYGVPRGPVAPLYTSTDCSACDAAHGFRHREMFRCLCCGNTRNADFNASVNISHRASSVDCSSHESSLSLCSSVGA